MKTIWKLLLVAILFAGQHLVNAQCVFYNTSSQSLTAQFNAYVWDSTSLPTDYYWDFGDGDTSHTLVASHTYASSATYNACLHYYSPTCNFDTCFAVTVDVCNYHMYVYNNPSWPTHTFAVMNAPAGSSYNWTFSDASGPISTSTSASPLFTVPTSGNYFAHVEVATPNGCTDTASQYVFLYSACHPVVYAYQTSPGSTEVQFSSSAVDSLSALNFTYSWTFGDGNTSTLNAPIHDYGAYGNYLITLTVTGNGCSDSVWQGVNVIPPYYTISGKLNYTSSGICKTRAYLIKEDSAGHLTLVGDYYGNIDSSCTGNYSFQVLAGTYYVKGGLDSLDAEYGNYLPTYYGDELLWANATPVVVTNSSVSNININLIAGNNPGGPGFVGGWVSQGAGLAIGGTHEERGIGDPLQNIQINLVTDNDVPVAYTITDANGRYTFSNLALGTYKVYAEEINKVPSPMSITLTANNPSQDNVDVSINSNSAVTGINDLFDLHVEGLFPNPVTDKATLTVSLKQNSSAQLRVIDTKGSVLTNDPIKLNAGANKIDINLSGKPAGIYLISLQGEAGSKIIRVAKAN